MISLLDFPPRSAAMCCLARTTGDILGWMNVHSGGYSSDVAIRDTFRSQRIMTVSGSRMSPSITTSIRFQESETNCIIFAALDPATTCHDISWSSCWSIPCNSGALVARAASGSSLANPIFVMGARSACNAKPMTKKLTHGGSFVHLLVSLTFSQHDEGWSLLHCTSHVLYDLPLLEGLI